MRVLNDIVFNEAGCKLDMYLPDTEGFETIVWFHGGGFECGDKDHGGLLAPSFVKAGYGFVSANYRMYPNGAKFPEFLCDAADAIAFVKGNIAAYGGKQDGLYVSGQSAGAWLSLMLCLNGEYLQKAGMDTKEIRGWIIDSAQTTSHFNLLKYELGEEARLQRINEFAPLYFLSEKTEFSKMLLLFYEKDIPCRYEQNMLFYKSVLDFNSKADIAYEVLGGGHCHGSSEVDEDGEYAYIKSALKWLQK